MSLLKDVQRLCLLYQIKPLRRRGQNFLINEDKIEKIIEVADLDKKDSVVEIGAGIGNLTKEISLKVKKVLAIEIDKNLVKILNSELKKYKNIKICQKDVREFNPKEYNLKKYKVVANIPFNITGLVLRRFLEFKIKPELMVLIIQKEVGERIIAQPSEMSRLAVMVNFYGQPEIIGSLGKSNFWPRPKVDSVILRIKTRPNLLFKNEKKFFQIVRNGFNSRRKYLLNNLVKSGIIEKEKGKKIFQKANLDLKIRAQELKVSDWVKLASLL